MFVSFVSTANIAAFWRGPEPKEASRIALATATTEKECFHLRRSRRREA
jgi:hypothetical protein